MLNLKKNINLIKYYSDFTSFLYNHTSHFMVFPRGGGSRYSVDRFIKQVSVQIPSGASCLDAGAGPQPYKEFLTHLNYEACDSQSNTFIENDPWYFICDLENIPRYNNTYDCIICSQVLEYVKNPAKVQKELFRVIKPGGKLFLTAPQCSGVHLAPENYFNFNRDGLIMLFKEAGFQNVEIHPLSGSFSVLVKIAEKCYEILFNKVPPSFKLFFYPIHLIVRMFLGMVSGFCFYFLDNLDERKDWSLHYGCSTLKTEIDPGHLNTQALFSNA